MGSCCHHSVVLTTSAMCGSRPSTSNRLITSNFRNVFVGLTVIIASIFSGGAILKCLVYNPIPMANVLQPFSLLGIIAEVLVYYTFRLCRFLIISVAHWRLTLMMPVVIRRPPVLKMCWWHWIVLLRSVRAVICVARCGKRILNVT